MKHLNISLDTIWMPLLTCNGREGIIKEFIFNIFTVYFYLYYSVLDPQNDKAI